MEATCRCGARWHQAGNRTGHCSACHRTFSGESPFDRHQTLTDRSADCHNGIVCADPATSRTKSGDPVYESFEDSAGCTVWRAWVSEENRAKFHALNEERQAARTDQPADLLESLKVAGGES